MRLRRSQALQLLLDFIPCGMIRLRADGIIRIFVKGQKILPQVGSDLLKVVFCQQIEKMRVGFVSELVFPGVGEPTGVEIGVGQF